VKKLLVLVFVAAICVPVCGEVLVYKTKQKANVFGYDNWAEALTGTGDYEEGITSGYLIINVSINPISKNIGAVSGAYWITYSKGKMSSLELQDLIVVYGRWKAKAYASIFSFSCFNWINSEYEPSERYVYGSSVMISGVVKRTSLLWGIAPINAPTVLNGSLQIEEDTAYKPSIGITSIVSFFDKKWTARANDLTDLGGDNAAYNTFWAINDYLVSKGYPSL
jgi:hypothetical protein